MFQALLTVPTTAHVATKKPFFMSKQNQFMLDKLNA